MNGNSSKGKGGIKLKRSDHDAIIDDIISIFNDVLIAEFQPEVTREQILATIRHDLALIDRVYSYGKRDFLDN